MNNFSKEDIFKGVVILLLLIIVFKLFAHKEKFRQSQNTLPNGQPCTFNTDCLSQNCTKVGDDRLCTKL